MRKNSIWFMLFTLFFSFVIVNFTDNQQAYAETTDTEPLETTTISNTTQGHIEVEAVLGTQQVLSKRSQLLLHIHRMLKEEKHT